MSTITKKIVVDERGNPVDGIIAWDVYQDLAERMGWDLSEDEATDVRVAVADWRGGNRDAFVPLGDLK